jgi:hypothetical protein
MEKEFFSSPTLCGRYVFRLTEKRVVSVFLERKIESLSDATSK